MSFLLISWSINVQQCQRLSKHFSIRSLSISWLGDRLLGIQVHHLSLQPNYVTHLRTVLFKRLRKSWRALRVLIHGFMIKFHVYLPNFNLCIAQSVLQFLKPSVNYCSTKTLTRKYTIYFKSGANAFIIAFIKMCDGGGMLGHREIWIITCKPVKFALH